jgi:DNA-directed RNA polymerase specialized sigma24 family protein
MGGDGGRFMTTHWSCVLSAKTTDETRRRLILNDLMEAYWKPVYCYLRNKGFDNETAKDLTQEFFAQIVLGRNLIQKADQSLGRFRTFLLVALERFVVSSLRYEGRMKRGGDSNVLRLEASDLANLNVSELASDPNQAFCHAWVTDLLDQVLTEVKEEYQSTERATYWEIFRLKILAPVFEDSKAPSYREIGEAFHMTDESKIANIVVTVKRRFRSVLKRHLRDLTCSDAEAEEELSEIFQILSHQGAR